ncbi:MAG TPA: cytochrome B [Rhizobiales bacterium]|nr:cytochrome B [Hyphomicrobiales bacterium]
MSVSTQRSRQDRAWTRPRTPSGVFVWDLPVRLFHWLLAGAVSTAAITGFFGPEWWLGVHRIAGYVIAFLIVFRVVWGFADSRFSRFDSFMFSLSTTIGHLGGLVRGRASHHLGHNPAGALMIFALIGVLSGLVISGLIVLGGQENLGILAAFVSFRTGSGAVAVHEILAIFLLVLIAGHLAGVLAESLLSRENLARAMVTGRKRGEPGAASLPQPQGSMLVRAGMVGVGILLVGTAISGPLLSLAPSGYVAMAANPVYASECGDCHIAYHPGLLPASSWKKLMAGLDNHFGEDASLDADTAGNIAKYLQRYSSEHWDSEAANNLRRVSPTDPLRITASPYWQRRHKAISQAVFRQKNIASRANCAACHSDAASGHFDDENIAIPAPARASLTNPND